MEVSLSYQKDNAEAFSYKDFLWLTIIAFYCTNFLNIGGYIPLVLSPYVFIYILRNKFSRTFFGTLFVLLTFCVLYTIILFMYNLFNFRTVLIYLVYPSCLYVLGYKLVEGDINYKKTYRYIFSIIVSSVLFGFLCVIKAISTYGEIASSYRVALNIWDGNVISATGINTYLSFGLPLLPILFLLNKTTGYGKMVKIASFISFIASAYSIIQLGNRTGLVIIVASFITISMLSERVNIQKITKIFFVVVLFLVSKILFDHNFLGVKYAWEGTLLASRFHENSLTQDPRLLAWKAAFNGLFEHPLGGKETDLPLSYAHNLWLDVGYEAGILPFLLLVIFTLFGVKAVITFIRSKHPIALKGLFIGLYTAFFITFFVEPILEGWFTYFNVFCFIIGIVQRLNFEYKNRNLNVQ